MLWPNALDSENYLKADPNAYFELADSIDQSLVSSVSFEDAHRTNDLKLLESFRETTVILGLIDVAKSRIEEAHQIRKRISRALEHISAD